MTMNIIKSQSVCVCVKTTAVSVENWEHDLEQNIVWIETIRQIFGEDSV